MGSGTLWIAFFPATGLVGWGPESQKFLMIVSVNWLRNQVAKSLMKQFASLFRVLNFLSGVFQIF